MNDEKMKEFLLNSFEQECNALDSIEVPEYQTSAKFQSKMNKILPKAYEIKRVTRKYAAACAMIFFALGVFASSTVYAASPTLRSFIISIFNEESKISVTEPEKYPDYILTCYMPTLIPDGFEEMKEISQTSSSYMTNFIKDGDLIFFAQYTKKIYNQVDMGSDDIEYYTAENGQEYIIVKIDDGYNVVWDNGDYVIQVFSTLSKEETLEICFSVEPVQK